MSASNIPNLEHVYMKYQGFQGFENIVGASNSIILNTTNGFINTATGSLPTAINAGDYIYWNGAEYVAGDQNICLGGNAGLPSGSNTGSVSIGFYAGNQSQGTGAIAIGYQACSTQQGDLSVAIGTNAQVDGNSAGSIALGANSLATSPNVLALPGPLFNVGVPTQTAGSIPVQFNIGGTQHTFYMLLYSYAP